MRRTLVRQHIFSDAPTARSTRRVAFPQGFQLAAQLPDSVGHFQHCLVLFGHVPLQIGDFLLEPVNTFQMAIQWKGPVSPPQLLMP